MRILLSILIVCAGLAANAQVILSGQNILSGTNGIGFTTTGGGGGSLSIVQTNTVKLLAVTTRSPLWSTNILTSVTAGNKLVGMFADEQDSTGVYNNATIVDSQGNTWTKRADAQATSSGNCEIWTAIAGSSGTIYVTNTWGQDAGSSGNVGMSGCVVEISGVETTLGGATNTATAQTAPSCALTTTRANSFIFGVVADWAAKAPPVTYRASGVQLGQDDQTTASYRADFYYIAATTATAYTTGETAPTAQSSGVCAYEIRTP